MKKPQDTRIYSLVTSVVDLRKWFDFDRMKEVTLSLAGGIKRIFIPAQATSTQTFEQALRQRNISEEALLKQQRALLRLSLLMCLIAVSVFVYSIYLLIMASWYSAILGVVVAMLALVLAFRYHFWFFQIKCRKLGCTFQEWFRQGLLGEKGSRK